MFFELLVKKTPDLSMLDAIANSICELIYSPDEGITFLTYYRKYEGIFENDCSYRNDKKKVRLLF